MRNWLISCGSLLLVRGQTKPSRAGRMPRAAAYRYCIAPKTCAAFGVRALARLAARQKEALEKSPCSNRDAEQLHCSVIGCGRDRTDAATRCAVQTNVLSSGAHRG